MDKTGGAIAEGVERFKGYAQCIPLSFPRCDAAMLLDSNRDIATALCRIRRLSSQIRHVGAMTGSRDNTVVLQARPHGPVPVNPARGCSARRLAATLRHPRLRVSGSPAMCISGPEADNH